VDYFEKAFSSSFKEGTEGVMYLPDDNPGAVGLFVHWLYKKELPIENTQSHLNNLVDVYIFGHKIRLAALKDKTMDTIQDMTLSFSLADKNFIPITPKVWTSTGDLYQGLQFFCVFIIVHGMVLRSIKPNYGATLRATTRRICDSDEQLMWDLGKANFKLFTRLLRVLEFELQICLNGSDTKVASKRRKALLEDENSCFSHCHKQASCISEGDDKKKNEVGGFVQDV